MYSFNEGGIGFQPVKFFKVVLRFADQHCVHRLEAYATIPTRKRLSGSFVQRRRDRLPGCQFFQGCFAVRRSAVCSQAGSLCHLSYSQLDLATETPQLQNSVLEPVLFRQTNFQPPQSHWQCRPEFRHRGSFCPPVRIHPTQRRLLRFGRRDPGDQHDTGASLSSSETLH